MCGLFGKSKKSDSFDANVQTRRIVVDPKTGERLIVRPVSPQPTTQRKPPISRPRPSRFGGSIMSELDRKHKAVFGNLFGGLLTRGTQLPSEVGQEVGGTLARGWSRFEEGQSEKFAAREVEKERQQAFEQSPSFFHKQTWEAKTKPLLEKAGMSHITYESYAKNPLEFKKIMENKLQAIKDKEPKPTSKTPELGDLKEPTKIIRPEDIL